LSDDFQRVISFIRTLSDTITVSDAPAKAFTTDREDTISLSDEITRATIFIISQRETIENVSLVTLETNSRSLIL